MTQRKFPVQNTIVGLFFHTYKDNPRTIKYQGLVVGKADDFNYIVQYYSWLIGEETNLAIVPIDEMLDWKFYTDEEHWRQVGNDECTRLRKKGE